LPDCQACAPGAPCAACGGQASGYFGDRFASPGLGGLLAAGTIRAKFAAGGASDSQEREADDFANSVSASRPTLQVRGETDLAAHTLAKGRVSQQRAPAALGLGPGQPLADSERGYFEQRLGTDLSSVRLHPNAPSADALRAHAFAAGRDIGFAPGLFRPGTSGFRKLLGHEIGHVVQQGKNGPTVQLQEAVPFTPAPAPGVPLPLPGPPPALPPRDPARAEQKPPDELNNPWKAGIEVSRPGLIQTSDGANLHPDPSLATTTERLGLNARVWVERSVAGFYFVVSDTGSSGFVQQARVTLDLPDAAAKLYTIQSGETALDIVKKFYKADAQGWGQDERFFVNVLVFVNQDKQRKGIYKPDPEGGWDATQTIADRTIWIPSLAYATALKGKVSSGSLSYETWSTVKDIAVAVGDFLAGSVSFIAGILHGALESVWDTLVGLVDLAGLVWKFLKSLITGNLLSDLRALWDDVSRINVSDLVAAGLDYLEKKWNDPSIWRRWHFRGWLVGYAIAEIVMLFFSEGILTAVKVSAKAGKLAAILDKFPSVVRFAKRAEAAAKEFKEAKAVSEAIKTLSAARDWAVKILKIPFTVIGDLTAEAIERLKRLPAWAKEVFAELSDAVKVGLLGCESPCKVDLAAIEKYLKELAAKGAAGAKKLTTVEEVLAALPKDLNVSKIRPYLNTKGALMKAIQKAELTDADFAKLADFLTGADKLNSVTAYETFTKYLTRVVPAKIGPDIKAFNEVLAEIIAADARQGAALKGHMFEAFARMHVPEFAGKTFERVSFRAADGTWKQADRFFAETGELWEVKHQLLEQVPLDQAEAYIAAVGSKTSAGPTIKSVHYLFPTEDAAKLNTRIKNLGVQIWYIDPPATLKAL
jgi:hypothetical protein